MEKKFQHNRFGKRLGSMLAVDFHRMFKTPLFYIMAGICLGVPVLILVMTTMMDGSVSVNPNTGVETVVEAFDSTWQIIGTVSNESIDEGVSMDMSMASMLNINMLYFAVAVLVSIFVSDDFRSGYAKNLFTVRAKKTDYVISKTIVGSIGSAFMIITFFVGTVIGGGVSGLPFEMIGFTAANLVMCLLSKILLVPIFVSIYLCMSVIGKQKLWMSMLLSFMVGMFLFNVAPMVSPLNATLMNVLLCIIGSVLFSIGMGSISNLLLKKRDIL